MVPKIGTEVRKFLEPIWTVRDSVWTVWVPWVMIYAINCVLMCMRPEMAMDFGFIKKNRYWKSGLPTDSPLALFWDCKNSLNLYEMDHKHPCVLALKLFEVNGLCFVEINRFMHKLDVTIIWNITVGVGHWKWNSD